MAQSLRIAITRRVFLRLAALLVLSALLPKQQAVAKPPTQTAGVFPFDLSATLTEAKQCHGKHCPGKEINYKHKIFIPFVRR